MKKGTNEGIEKGFAIAQFWTVVLGSIIVITILLFFGGKNEEFIITKKECKDIFRLDYSCEDGKRGSITSEFTNMWNCYGGGCNISLSTEQSSGKCENVKVDEILIYFEKIDS